MPSTHKPSAWGGSIFEDFQLPSGDTCQLRKIDIMEFLENGILQETDGLGTIVQGHIKKATTIPGKKPSADEIGMEVLKDRKSMGKTKDMIYMVCVAAVAQPKIHMMPDDDADRDDEKIYVDTVPFADRMAIFSHVMSQINSLKSDSAQPTTVVGIVEHVEDTPHSPERISSGD